MTFELEEEFDPVKLGLVAAVSTRAEGVFSDVHPPHVGASATDSDGSRSSLRGDGKAADRDLPPVAVRPRPAARKVSGKYASADWEPSSEPRCDRNKGQSSPSPSPSPAPIKRHDFANGNVGAKSASPVKDQTNTIAAPANGPLIGPDSASALQDGSYRATGAKGARMSSTSSSIEQQDARLIPAVPNLTSGSIHTTLSFASAILTDTVSKLSSTVPTIPRSRRNFHVDRIKVRLSGRGGYRWGLRVRRSRGQPGSPVQGETVPPPPNLLEDTERPPSPAPPGTSYQRDLHATFPVALPSLQNLARQHNTSGDRLPPSARDVFPALSDLKTTVSMANDLRTQLDLPLLSLKSDKVALRRVIATTRAQLYIDIAAALILPLAPLAIEEEEAEGDKEDKMDRPDMSLTPTNLEIMTRMLAVQYPHDKAAVKAFLAEEGGNGACGELGHRVVWEQGVGRMTGKEGAGFRGKVNTDGAVHVFVDHSNVLHGLLHHFYPSNSPSLPPRHLRTLSLPCLSLLLRRGRPTEPGTLHLVASSPLKQDLDPLVRLGWEVSVLKRVEVYEDEVLDPEAMTLRPKVQYRPHVGSGVGGVGGQGGAHGHLYGHGHGHGLGRFREQGVDEILHLKLLQALNTKPVLAPKGSTIVLATGDARGGQFNRDGFMGAVKEALKRGWAVELWSWRSGLSRAWAETAKRERWDSRFGIHLLDDWAETLIEVAQEEEEA